MQARCACRPLKRREAPERETQLSTLDSRAHTPCAAHLALRVDARHLRPQHLHTRLLKPLERPFDDCAGPSVRLQHDRARRAKRACGAPSNTSARRVTRSTFSTHCVGQSRAQKPGTTAVSAATARTLSASPGATSVSRSPGRSRASSSRAQQTPDAARRVSQAASASSTSHQHTCHAGADNDVAHALPGAAGGLLGHATCSGRRARVK